uniref:Potassium channel tetramerisation-type BTB domain-containing protein n=1 Tax=Minutocellus polymorphus TaxID=265543 RepID=A0A7S0AHL9_9STRA|mmetsp:Transcript_14301/g.23862  ORF Transcript_14301/g.23862 Transcript_14301/m.23862 type:complete len:273 (+) Transcript_14301:137-955(+)
MLLSRYSGRLRCVLTKQQITRGRQARRNIADEPSSAPTQITETALDAPSSTAIARHGTGDAVVVLDVGGKEFKTLRSTVDSNSVLSSLVVRAEANAELTQGGKAIFIDRDPKHFGIILQHLRNKVDGLSYGRVDRYLPANSKKMAIATVQLPAEKEALRDIFMESQYYDIKELQQSACGQSLLTMLMQNFGLAKGANPFDEASKFLLRLKRGLIAGVGLMGVSNAQNILDILPEKVKSSTLLAPEIKLLEELSRSDDGKAQKANKENDSKGK